MATWKCRQENNNQYLFNKLVYATVLLALIVFFLNWANPGLSFDYFRSFKTNITILQQINVKNVQMSPGFEPTTFRTWVDTHNR